MRLVVNSVLELLQEQPQIQDVAIKNWNLDTREIDSTYHRHSYDFLFMFFLGLFTN